jgi:hypothetical protein
VVHQDPHWFDQPRNRWTLSGLAAACDWLEGQSASGVFRMLHRFAIHYKRAQGHLFSPDPDYLAKLADIQTILTRSQADPERVVVVFADEIGLYRQPTLAQAYEVRGSLQPRAELGHRTNLCVRVAGALNIWSGRISYQMKTKFTVGAMVGFYEALANAYPDAEVIYVILDNWPLHYHPDVLAALEPQEFKYPLHQPGSWPTEPSPKARRLNLPIRLVLLPTYAPWTNPIEKLWRRLRQEELHLHRFGDHWEALKQCVRAYLDRLAYGSQELLRYVGLSDPLQLYQTAFQLNHNCVNARC